MGMVALGYSRRIGKVIVLQVKREVMTWTRQKREVGRWYGVFQPRLMVVEKNHYQAALAAQAGEDFPTMPVLPVFTGMNKIDPMVGIEAMQPHFERGFFVIPYKTAYDQRLSDLLIDEFTHWPLWPTSDLLMAFWLAWVRLEILVRRFSAARQAARIMRFPGSGLTDYDRLMRQVREGGNRPRRLPVRARRGSRMARRERARRARR